MNSYRLMAAVLTAAFSLSLAACNSSKGGAIATVNGQQISKSAFDTKLETSSAGRGVLNQMIQSDLIDQYATENKIEPTSAQIDEELTKLKARYPNGQFDQIVKQQGLTNDDVRNILREQLVLQQSVAKRIPPITSAQVAAFYKQNHAMLDKPEQVRARHILVPDLKTAQMIEGKLKSGGDFAALAKQYSADPASKEKGGELGFFGHGQMVQPFDKAAFSLKVGQISQPVKSPFGYHIIQVEEKKPAVKATLAGSNTQIRQTLMQQAEQQQMQPFLQELRSKATITVTDQRFSDLASTPLPPAPSTPTGSAAPTAAPASAPAAASPAATK
ncbi:MAG: peptidylprolyl isomerase [Vulcanimicrobiaceae bacterium]